MTATQASCAGKPVSVLWTVALLRLLLSELVLLSPVVARSSAFLPLAVTRREFVTSSVLLQATPAHTTPASTTMKQQQPQVWYNDPDLGRDRTHILKDDVLAHVTSEHARYLLVEEGRGLYHTKLPPADPDHPAEIIAKPLYLDYAQVVSVLGSDAAVINLLDGSEESKMGKSLLVWIGKKQETDYWALYMADDETKPTGDAVSDRIAKTVSVGGLSPDQGSVEASPLREFGDLLESVHDAGILATANGLIEFHKSHPFCHRCGAATISVKAGASRRCTGCNASTYPRMDVASIMLITSPCEQYALLGRKTNWPSGRYSTLAGFTEVGETIESSCVRETMEESGIRVDPASVQIVCSQPWPFPRSLMVGFRGKALPNEKNQDELPLIDNTIDELEDVQWFHKDFVAERLERGMYSTLTFDPTGEDAEFHLPGRASLARILISQWATS
eukprot:scaffold2204_cov166-Amphora_coffeaeformis.AAC.16